MEMLKRLQEQEMDDEVGQDGLEDEEVEEELSLQERLEGLNLRE